MHLVQPGHRVLSIAVLNGVYVCQNLELVAMVRARLLKEKAMALPRVHIHSSNGPRVAELQRLVQGLKGELIGSQGTGPKDLGNFTWFNPDDSDCMDLLNAFWSSHTLDLCI